MTQTGDLYLLDQLARMVVVFDRSGQQSRQFVLIPGSVGTTLQPTSIAVDQTADVLMIADASQNLLCAFSLWGNFRSRITAGPSAIAFDPGGRLWVCDRSGSQLVAGQQHAGDWKIIGRTPADVPVAVSFGFSGNDYLLANGTLLSVIVK